MLSVSSIKTFFCTDFTNKASPSRLKIGVFSLSVNCKYLIGSVLVSESEELLRAHPSAKETPTILRLKVNLQSCWVLLSMWQPLSSAVLQAFITNRDAEFERCRGCNGETLSSCVMPCLRSRVLTTWLMFRRNNEDNSAFNSSLSFANLWMPQSQSTSIRTAMLFFFFVFYSFHTALQKTSTCACVCVKVCYCAA